MHRRRSLLLNQHLRARIGAITLVGIALCLSACGSGSKSTSAATSSQSTAATSAAAASGATSLSAQYNGAEAQLPHLYPQPAIKPGFKFTVGFLNPLAANESLLAEQNAIAATAKRLGGTMIAKDDQLSVNKQVSDFKQLLAQHVSAIIVQPIDPKSLGPALAQAKAANVPVVGVDVTAAPAEQLPSGFTTEVLSGRDTQAYLLSRAMAAANPHGQVGVIGIGAPVVALKYLVQRINYWSKLAGLTVLGEADNPSDDVAGGQSAGSSLLGRYSALNGVIAYNDPSALGAVAAARTSGRHIVAVGNNGGSDGIAGVEGGRLAATFQINSVGEGYNSVIAAYDAVTQQHLPLAPKTIAPPHPVTKANVAQVKTWPQQIAIIQAGGSAQ